jgi:hypothetical protein
MLVIAGIGWSPSPSTSTIWPGRRTWVSAGDPCAGVRRPLGGGFFAEGVDSCPVRPGGGRQAGSKAGAVGVAGGGGAAGGAGGWPPWEAWVNERGQVVDPAVTDGGGQSGGHAGRRCGVPGVLPGSAVDPFPRGGCAVWSPVSGWLPGR